MAVYNPKTKQYEDEGSVKTRPQRNYNFKLDATAFGKKYLTYKYTPQEFTKLAASGYVASYGNGILGVKAPAYATKYALGQIRKGFAPPKFVLPDNFVGNNLVPVETLPDPSPVELLAWNKRAEDYDLASYIEQYGHPPSEDSVYYQYYKPGEVSGPALDEIRTKVVEQYQVRENYDNWHTLWRLGQETGDPNIQKLASGGKSGPSSTGIDWSPADRANVRQVLRDFGLTKAGASTIPYDIGSKYVLPAGIAGTAADDNYVGSGRTAPAAGSSTNRNIGAAVLPASSLLRAISENAVIKSLVTNPDGPLAATPASEVTPLSFLGNALKGMARAGLGFPMGVASIIDDPAGMGTAILKDYGKRYGALWGDPDSNFIESTLEDPTLPILDALGVVPGVGLAAKGAQLGKVLAVTSKGTRVARGSALELQTAERIALAEAYDAAGGVKKRPEDFSEEEVAASAARSAQEKIRNKPAFTPSGQVSREGKSAARFAKEQRAAILDPDNDMLGLNTAYSVGRLDRAAALFEPRYGTFSLAELLPEGVGKDKTPDLVDTMQELTDSDTPEGLAKPANIRFAGSPLARGVQKAFFSGQRAVGKKALAGSKTAGWVFNLPLLGYNYRYANALRLDASSTSNDTQKNLIQQKALEDIITAYKLTEPEQMAVGSEAMGGIGALDQRINLAKNRLAIDEEKGGPNTNQVKQLKIELAMLEDPAFFNAYTTAIESMYSGVPSERGAQLIAAQQRLRVKHDIARNEVGYDVSQKELSDLLRIYAPVIGAYGLDELSIIKRIKAASKNTKKFPEIARFVTDFYVFSPSGSREWDIPLSVNGRKDLVKLSDLAANKPSSKQELEAWRDALIFAQDEIAKPETLLGPNNQPIFIVSGYVDGPMGSKGVVGRVVRANLRMSKTEGNPIRFDKTILSDEITLPLDVFDIKPANRGRGREAGLYKQADFNDTDGNGGAELLNRAVLNRLIKEYPDARDFTDKVSTETLSGKEMFAQEQNNNIIMTSGFADWKLKTQFSAHNAAINRRFYTGIQRQLEDSAIPMTVAQYNALNKTAGFVPLKTMVIHDTYEAAAKYAQDLKLNGASTPGEVVPAFIGGKDVFVSKLKFIDSSRYVIQEAQTKRFIEFEKFSEDVIMSDEAFQRLLDESTQEAYIMVVPKHFIERVAASYKRSDTVASKIAKTGSDFFKLFALSLNPRFVSQQVFGGAVMLMLTQPMNAGAIMAKFMEYSFNNMSRAVKRKTGRTIKNDFVNHGDDYDIIYNYFIRDFEDNIYMQDANTSFINKSGMGKTAQAAKEAAHVGYTIAFSFEKNIRVAVARKAALEYPGFKDFMDNSDLVTLRAAQGMPEAGYNTISRFAAAMELTANPTSPVYKSGFLNEIRHTADMVSGNYRDFTKTERAIRNYLIPFYGWTRHSALFTKRLVQERPTTALGVYNTGNYGYEEIFRRGGVPDWLLESIPMPSFIEEVLGLDPAKINRLGAGSINPFGVSGNVAILAADALTGDARLGDNNLFDFTSPYVNLIAEQATGRSTLTGLPVEKRNLAGGLSGLISGLPAWTIVGNTYKSYAELNALRGNENPEDIFQDPFDPNSKLKNTPEDKLNTKFPTLTSAGLFNVFSPVKGYSLDPEQMGESIRREYTMRGMQHSEQVQNTRKGAWRTINALSKWKQKRDFINSVWLPEFGATNPELAVRVTEQLQAEFPDIPSTFPAGFVQRVLDGSLTLPDAASEVVVYDPSARRASVKYDSVTGPSDPATLVAANQYAPSAGESIIAGEPNTETRMTIDGNGFVSVNGKPYIDEATGRRVKYLVNARGEVIYDPNTGMPMLDVAYNDVAGF